jgi:hypothetical protein
VTKRHSLLRNPTGLQRWLDFLLVYGLTPHNLHNLLLRVQPELLEHTTLFQAGQVVTFLKALGIKDDFLAGRVLALFPQASVAASRHPRAARQLKYPAMHVHVQLTRGWGPQLQEV